MLRVRTVFSGPAGTPWLNTFYFTAPTENGASAAAANAAVGDFWNAVDANMALTVSWATESEVVTVDLQDEATGSYTVTPATGTGTASGDMLPAANQGLIRWRTGTYLGGRELRGRTFVPGLTESAAVVGFVSAPVRASIDAAAGTLITNATVDLVVFGRTAAVSATITSGQTWTQFAVLRSRRD